jgi:uncharacterized repeat protein (TIGR03803 family)
MRRCLVAAAKAIPGCVLALATIGSPAAVQAARFDIVHAFKGGSDGQYPEAGLTVDPSGNLVGTTLSGGPGGAGTVFRIAPDGSEEVLYAFKGGSDGYEPVSGLQIDSRGNLFGTTTAG